MKWDDIDKERLYDLYITRNLSKPEIRKILGIPETSLGRLLKRYGIVKSKELFLAMQCRISQAEHDSRSEETKRNLSLKLKACWDNLSEEKKEERRKIFSRVNSNRTEEHKEKLRKSNKLFYDNESEEHRQKRIEKTRETTIAGMHNMSEEKKQEMNKNRIQGLANMSQEKKKARIEKMRNTWARKSDAEKLEIYKKQTKSKEKNGSMRSSSGEKELKTFIEELGFETKRYISGCGDTRFELDIFVPSLNVAIEYNGAYYHSTNGINKRIKTYHYNKSMFANKMGIELIHVWEDQWLNQRSLIETILKSRLGVLKENRIYARKCVVKEIASDVYRVFCEKNHIQGYRFASVKLGLFYNDELVQIASFNKVRNLGKQNRTEEWEWIRGCPASLNSVVGGTSKLFKYFVKNYNPNSVLCYADWNLFNGKGYEECGFKFTGYTGPDKFYIKNRGDRSRLSRNPYKYAEHKDLVKKNVLFECYGAGSKRFVWTRNK